MTQIKNGGTERKARVSKSDWLNMALSVLKEGGIEAVRVERLAGRLGVAKSGFYYHFKDRTDLSQQMLDYWLALDGSPLLRERMSRSVTPEERLHIIIEAIEDSDLSRIDAAIRQWGRQDLKVRRIWRKEMNKRMDHIRGIFTQLGFEGDDLEMRVRTFVGYHVTEHDLFDDLTKKEKTILKDLRVTLLTKRE